MKKINKAVISCAGFGTRFLPISKTIQKEMLPLFNKPVLDYIVEDCVKAGITDIILVINEHNYQPLHYFRENLRLKKYLANMNKSHLYDKVSKIHQQVNFIIIKQADHHPYGTSIPLILAQQEIKNEEAFLYLTGDDLVFFNDAKRSFLQELINEYQQSKAEAAISAVLVPDQLISMYGIISHRKEKLYNFLEKMVEKPSREVAPTNLANISKYILTPDILPIINKQSADNKSGEYFITDAIEQLAQTKNVLVHQTTGKYLNAGDPVNWLKANLTVAGANPAIKKELLEFIEEEWGES